MNTIVEKYGVSGMIVEQEIRRGRKIYHFVDDVKLPNGNLVPMMRL